MPKLHDVAEALRLYRSRYETLDAFADDIDEIRDQTLDGFASVVEAGPNPRFLVPAAGEPLSVQLFPEQGIARFKLGSSAPPQPGDRATAGAAVGGLLGAALAAARNTKEGLLGGLILGMLVGGLTGAAAQPVERVLALQFDPDTLQWRLYDGPLLRWAKRTLQPAA